MLDSCEEIVTVTDDRHRAGLDSTDASGAIWFMQGCFRPAQPLVDSTVTWLSGKSILFITNTSIFKVRSGNVFVCVYACILKQVLILVYVL